MKLEDHLTVICFARQDDTSEVPKSRPIDGKAFLDRFSSDIRNLTSLLPFTLVDEFFVLGRASKAFILSTSGLYHAAELIGSFNRCQSSLGRQINSPLGVFELFAFPTIDVKEGTRSAKGIIPSILFCRVSRVVNDVQAVLADKELSINIARTMIGFGIYNLVFLLKGKTITHLSRSISAIRNYLSFRETSTIIGIPKTHLRDRERKLAASEPFHKFTIMIKCHGGIGRRVGKEIVKIAEEKFSGIFQTLLNKQDKITYRQGYMDLEVPCHSQTVGEVFDASCEFRRRIDGVIETATALNFELQ